MTKLTPEDEEHLRAPITQTSQSRTVGLIVLVIFVAILLVLASCSDESDPIWLGEDEVCVDVIVGPGALDSISRTVPADSFRVMADGTVVRFIPCAL